MNRLTKITVTAVLLSTTAFTIALPASASTHGGGRGAGGIMRELDLTEDQRVELRQWLVENRPQISQEDRDSRRQEMESVREQTERQAEKIENGIRLVITGEADILDQIQEHQQEREAKRDEFEAALEAKLNEMGIEMPEISRPVEKSFERTDEGTIIMEHTSSVQESVERMHERFDENDGQMPAAGDGPRGPRGDMRGGGSFK